MLDRAVWGFCPASLPACACSAGLVSGYGVVTGGFVAKGWVIAKLLRGGFEGVSVVVTVGIKALRAQLFCLLSPYGRQVSPRGSTALDLHLPIPPASGQVPSSASCCNASCYIHVTIKSSTAFLRQVSPSGTVLARCSSAVTCSIIVASASACLLLLQFCCLVPSHASPQ